MRRFLALTLALCLTAAIPAAGWYDPGTDYMAVMLVAVTEGDWDRGLEAQLARDEKIDELGLAWPKIGYEDLCLLAKVLELAGESAAREVLRRTGDEGVAVALFRDCDGDVAALAALCPSRSSAETAQKMLSDWAICAEKDIAIS
jgi:hypothetical protein